MTEPVPAPQVQTNPLRRFLPLGQTKDKDPIHFHGINKYIFFLKALISETDITNNER